MGKHCFISIFILLFILALPAFAMDPGETGAVFLKIGVGAAPVGMGEAYTAVTNDVNAVYSNPAGLANVLSPQAQFMHLEWFQGIRYENIVYAQPLRDFGWGDIGVAGIQISGLYTGIENKVSGAPGSSDGWEMNPEGYYVTNGPTYAAYNLGFILAYGYPLRIIKGHPIDLGASMKLLVETIDVYTGWGGGADIGGIYHVARTDWYQSLKPVDIKISDQLNFERVAWQRIIPNKVGVALQNLGGIGAMRPNSEGSILPVLFKFGAGYDFNFLDTDSLIIGIELQQPIDNYTRLHLGGEYKYTFPVLPSVKVSETQFNLFNLTLAGRLGYKIGGGIQTDLDALAGLSLGLGAGATIESVRGELDYALVPYGVLSQDNFLSSTHRVSLTLEFGETGKIRKAATGL